MRILMISQYYSPEPFRHPDICQELVKRGHQVTAVVGTPNYPMGKIYPGYRFGKRRDEVIQGVRVHRCFTIGRRNNNLFRVLNYYSYALSAKAYLRRMKSEYDVVFVNQLSPVMMAEPAMQWKKRYGTRVVLYCLDLWPESLIAGGVTRSSALYRMFHKVSERIYKRADRVLITSRAFADYFREEFGIEKTEYLPQYAEAIFTPEQCRKTADEYVDLMFAGNVGAAQSVDTILEAAKLTQDLPNLRWHIVGDGSELKRLEKQAAGLTNVIIHGRKPLEEMPEMYAKADAMLVTMQKDPIISMTLPGKVQTYLAAGKPVLGAIDGEAAYVIADAQCGLCGPAEDGARLAQNARDFLSCDRAAMADNARKYYLNHFEKQRFLDALEKALAFQENA